MQLIDEYRKLVLSHEHIIQLTSRGLLPRICSQTSQNASSSSLATLTLGIVFFIILCHKRLWIRWRSKFWI